MGRRPAERPDLDFLVVDQPAVQPELVGDSVEGHHVAEVADEPLVRPEDHRAQHRVQPVRPDHQVEAPPGAAREGHVDAVRVLGELGDPVAEDVLDTVPGVVVEHPGQVPAQDLDLRDVPVAPVVVRAVSLQHVPGHVDGVRASGLGAGRAHGRVQPHPPDDLSGHPACVHRRYAEMITRVSAAMRVRRAFADVILNDAGLGDLRLISRNGRAESACPATR